MNGLAFDLLVIVAGFPVYALTSPLLPRVAARQTVEELTEASVAPKRIST